MKHARLTWRWGRISISEDLAKVKVAFSCWDGGTSDEAQNGKTLVGFQEIGCHMIFDAKMDGNLARQGRLVARTHQLRVARERAIGVCCCRTKLFGFACCRCLERMPACGLPQEDLDHRRTGVRIGFGLCHDRCSSPLMGSNHQAHPGGPCWLKA